MNRSSRAGDEPLPSSIPIRNLRVAVTARYGRLYRAQRTALNDREHVACHTSRSTPKTRWSAFLEHTIGQLRWANPTCLRSATTPGSLRFAASSTFRKVPAEMASSSPTVPEPIASPCSSRPWRPHSAHPASPSSAAISPSASYIHTARRHAAAPSWTKPAFGVLWRRCGNRFQGRCSWADTPTEDANRRCWRLRSRAWSMDCCCFRTRSTHRRNPISYVSITFQTSGQLHSSCMAVEMDSGRSRSCARR
jgi:hypothetical protein